MNWDTTLLRPARSFWRSRLHRWTRFSFICWALPGTGKLTIARAFARAVGAEVVDNHWINIPDFRPHRSGWRVAFAECGLEPDRQVREAVLETIATLAKPGMNFVSHARWHRGGRERLPRRRAAQGIQSTAARRAGPGSSRSRSVCGEDELVRRIQSADRASMLIRAPICRCHPQK